MHMAHKTIFLPLIMLLFGVACLCCISYVAQAEDGRDLFASKCCNCHRTGGEASVIGPTNYAAFQWKKFFEADRHKRKKDISDLITANESDLLKNFLMKHASDSEQPEGIGMSMQGGK